MSDAQFDEIQAGYESIVEESISFSGLRHDFFMAAKADLLSRITRRHFADSDALSLLDIGCGVGRLHPHLQGMFGTITGCDVSDKSVERARRENSFARYDTSADDVLPYADGQFDIVLTVCVMHHVPPAQWQAFLREMRRTVRPGGIAVVIEHNPFNPLTRLAVARCAFDADAVLLSQRRTRRTMLEAGFSDASIENFLFLPTAAPWARRLESFLTNLPLGAQYAAIGVV
ncbi:methyltransferase domain-containing protein [Devosia ginsengisoli]|uniref:Class I SAM-dependent methyltransferase n=1 Tax=Devosia ginsengisoli TaxID=400770 RepID=A0A5B8LTQ2_9HYPH|nr:methyltransferase domain-containing protein [Devosia ginsengisoli]QDZ10660.1 class I SAM-dependent methyltransferase [Devosia ginsengisoli]